MNFSPILKKLKLSLAIHAKEHQELSNSPYSLGACCMDKHYSPISFGYNSYTKTHPAQKQLAVRIKKDSFKEFLHAEISALVKCRDKKPYAILVLRQLKDGKLGNAKPCPICSMAIKEAGIEEVWFSNEEGNIVIMEGDKA